MARNCNNERMAMIMQYVAVGSMIIMAGVAASQVLGDAFGPTDDHRGRGGRGSHAPDRPTSQPESPHDSGHGRKVPPTGGGIPVTYAEETALVGPAHTLST